MTNHMSYAGEIKLPDVNLSLDLFYKEQSREFFTVVVHTERLQESMHCQICDIDLF